MSNLINLLDNIVKDYAEYDALTEQYDLLFDDIPDFLQHELSAYLIEDEEDFGMDLLTSNNPTYQTILSALIAYLKDTTNHDKKTDFLYALETSMSSYHRRYLSELLAERIDIFNQIKLAA